MNEWRLICHRAELAHDGCYAQLPGVAAYNNNGDIVVWNGICPHRGTQILDIGVGRKSLVCPYHRWDVSAISPKVDRFLTGWVGDFLFAGNGAIDLDTQLGGARALLEEISANIRARYSFDTLPMNCKWQYAVENALEDMHVAQIHPETIGKIGLSKPVFSKLGKNSLALYAVDKRIAAALGSNSYFHLLIYQNTCISSVGGATYSIQQYFPSGDSTLLLTRLYSSSLSNAQPQSSDFFLEKAREFNLRVFREDAEICSRIAGDGTILTEAEMRVRWFREAGVQR